MEQPIPSRRRYTVEEYLRLDDAAQTRSEFRDGEIINMPGGTFDHEGIIHNLGHRLGERLEGSDCLVRGSNLRVRVDRTRYCYPDLTVTCGSPRFDPPEDRRTLLNPQVVIEVLSPSTETIDRGEKFFRYMQVESLQEYLLVAQDQPRIQTFYRHPEGMWAVAGAVEGMDAVLRVRSLGIEVPLAQVYADVTFPPVVPSTEPEK